MRGGSPCQERRARAAEGGAAHLAVQLQLFGGDKGGHLGLREHARLRQAQRGADRAHADARPRPPLRGRVLDAGAHVDGHALGVGAMTGAVGAAGEEDGGLLARLRLARQRHEAHRAAVRLGRAAARASVQLRVPARAQQAAHVPARPDEELPDLGGPQVAPHQAHQPHLALSALLQLPRVQSLRPVTAAARVGGVLLLCVAPVGRKLALRELHVPGEGLGARLHGGQSRRLDGCSSSRRPTS